MDQITTNPTPAMKSTTLTAVTPFTLAPLARSTRRSRQAGSQPAGIFSHLERETAAGDRPEAVAFALLALTAAAWPTYEALRAIFTF